MEHGRSEHLYGYEERRDVEVNLERLMLALKFFHGYTDDSDDLRYLVLEYGERQGRLDVLEPRERGAALPGILESGHLNANHHLYFTSTLKGTAHCPH